MKRRGQRKVVMPLLCCPQCDSLTCERGPTPSGTGTSGCGIIGIENKACLLADIDLVGDDHGIGGNHPQPVASHQCSNGLSAGRSCRAAAVHHCWKSRNPSMSFVGCWMKRMPASDPLRLAVKDRLLSSSNSNVAPLRKNERDVVPHDHTAIVNFQTVTTNIMCAAAECETRAVFNDDPATMVIGIERIVPRAVVTQRRGRPAL